MYIAYIFISAGASPLIKCFKFGNIIKPTNNTIVPIENAYIGAITQISILDKTNYSIYN